MYFLYFYTNSDVKKINRKLNVEIYKWLAAIMVHNVAVLLPFNDHWTNKKNLMRFYKKNNDCSDTFISLMTWWIASLPVRENALHWNWLCDWDRGVGDTNGNSIKPNNT